MDEITQLHCRNAALETELRIVKEQLAQAHGATNYLATTFSKQQTTQQADVTAHLQERLDSVQVENVHLRAALGIHGGLNPSFDRRQTVTSRPPVRFLKTPALRDQLHLAEPPTPRSTGEEHVGLGEETDLLSFDDGDSLLSTETFPQNQSIVPQVASSSPDTLLDSVPLSDDVKTIEHGDGAFTYVMSTPAVSLFRPRATESPYGQQIPSPPLRAPTGPRRCVPDHVHRRLAGRACFVEDWEAEDWETWAAKERMFSTEGWKKYYAEKIRPQYLEKEATRAASWGGAVGAGGVEQTEELAKKKDGSLAEVGIAGTEVAQVLAEVRDEDPDAGDSVNNAGGDEEDADSSNQGKEEDSADVEVSSGDADTNGTLATELEMTAERGHASMMKNVAPLSHDDAEQALGVEKQAKFPRQTPEPEEGLAASRWAQKPSAKSFYPEAAQATGSESAVLNSTHLLTAEGHPDNDVGALDVTLLVKTDDQCPTQSPSGHIVHAAPSRGTREQPVRGWNSERYDRRGSHFAGSPPFRYQEPGYAIAGSHPALDAETKSTVFSHSGPGDLRTVQISGIPPNVTLQEVLDKIRGGKIVSAIFLRTAGMNTNPPMQMNAVMVTFLHARDAQTYVEFCTRKVNIFFWSESWEAPFKATVSLLQTASRHVDPVLRHQEASRVIYLADNGTWEVDHVVAKLLSWSRFDTANDRPTAAVRPVRYGRDQDGILWFEFASLADAGMAKFVMDDREREFGRMSKGYLPDPCARAVEGLAEVAEAKRPEMDTSGHGDGGAASLEEAAGSEQDGDEDLFGTSEDTAIETTDGSTATSPSSTPAYVHSASTAEDMDVEDPSTLAATAPPKLAGRYTSEDVEFARALMSSFRNNQGQPPHRRARPRDMVQSNRSGDVFNAEVLREEEAMGVEG